MAIMASARRQSLLWFLDAFAAGRLPVPAAQRYPLRQAGQAMTDFGAHKFGKLVVSPG
jgi:hypothetical protein